MKLYLSLLSSQHGIIIDALKGGRRGRKVKAKHTEPKGVHGGGDDHMDMYGQRRYKDWIDSQRRQALHLVGTENNLSDRTQNAHGENNS